MRPITSLALHSILAGALIAFAATSAAAADALKLLATTSHIKATETPSREAQKDKWIEVHSHTWVAASSSSAQALAVSDPGASGPKTTAKRQHKPMTITKEWDANTPMMRKPPDKGSLTVSGSFPDCAVGARYAGAQFASAGMQYELKDVVISGCSAGSLSLDYGKVTVRGWDPKPKQQ